jgi:hypothetical protein
MVSGRASPQFSSSDAEDGRSSTPAPADTPPASKGAVLLVDDEILVRDVPQAAL